VAVVGLGVDLVELDRVARTLEKWGDKLVSKLMGPPEAARLPIPAGDRARSLALAIAAKEAASKAIGTGWSRGVRWRDVEVWLSPPRVSLLERAAEVARSFGASGEPSLRFELRGNLVLAEVRLLS
jgi:holo-[acyl-carrier protein] synthase